MSTDTRASRNVETSHVAADDASSDVDGPISEAALNSAAFYTKGLDVEPFQTLPQLKKSIGMLSKCLADGETETQFYAFSGVPKKLADRANNNLSLLAGSTRIMYFWNEEVMIVKLPSTLDYRTHFEFAMEIRDAVLNVGIPGRQFIGTPNGYVEGPNSSKQGDIAFKPLPARGYEDDKPTIVVEAGYSHGQRSLRANARWWLSNTNGDVKIAILVSIYGPSKRLVIEKWCHIPRIHRTTRHTGGVPGIFPELVQTLAVSHIRNTPVHLPTSYDVEGAPLTLEFDKLFLRAPNPPEQDISLGMPELQDWAGRAWCMEQQR